MIGGIVMSFRARVRLLREFQGTPCDECRLVVGTATLVHESLGKVDVGDRGEATGEQQPLQGKPKHPSWVGATCHRMWVHS